MTKNISSRQEDNSSTKSSKLTSLQNCKQPTLQNGEHTIEQDDPHQNKRPKQFRDREDIDMVQLNIFFCYLQIKQQLV